MLVERTLQARLNAESIGEESYNAYKKTMLPAATFSAWFDTKQRITENVQEHTGIVGLDFDHLSSKGIDPRFIRDGMGGHPAVALAFISPSGDGVKVFAKVSPVPATPQQHYAAWEAVTRTFTGADIGPDLSDPQCKDITRLCFLAHDPDVYYNPEPNAAIGWEMPVEVSVKESRDLTLRDIYEAAKALYAIPRVYYDGEDLHTDWAKIICAGYHSGLEYDLVKAWDDMGDKHGKSRNFEATWRSAGNRDSSVVGVGTLVHYARMFGGRFGEKLCSYCGEEWIGVNDTVCAACPEPVTEETKLPCYSCRRTFAKAELEGGVCEGCQTAVARGENPVNIPCTNKDQCGNDLTQFEMEAPERLLH